MDGGIAVVKDQRLSSNARKLQLLIVVIQDSFNEL